MRGRLVLVVGLLVLTVVAWAFWHIPEASAGGKKSELISVGMTYNFHVADTTLKATVIEAGDSGWIQIKDGHGNLGWINIDRVWGIREATP